MGQLDDRQIVLVVGQKNYNAEEFDYLFEALEKEGADISVASNTLDKALARLGGYVAPDCTISDLSPDDFDAVILLGGYGARVYLWDDQDTHDMLRRFAEANKLIGAVSTAPVALANAGVLANRKATVFPDYESTLIFSEAGVIHLHDHVVVDENIITCEHSKFIKEFADAVIEKLKG
ncbi:MAG: hypothetical protein D6748_09545 [Calditrichaeota bacterium]|nr:MAG: hypothetical protein D6748_09545 [Calditrichota bacterium]